MLVMQTLRVADSCVIDAHVLLVLADEWGRVSHPDAAFGHPNRGLQVHSKVRSSAGTEGLNSRIQAIQVSGPSHEPPEPKTASTSIAAVSPSTHKPTDVPRAPVDQTYEPH